jgi:hypothetical protein
VDGENEPLNGIIVSKDIFKSCTNTNLLASIENLDKATWWQNRSPSIRVYRTTNDYLHHLRLVFCHANSIMFIDPYIDPVKYNYREFFRLLEGVSKIDIPPCIEIHMCNLNDTCVTEYEQDFRRKLSHTIKTYKLSVDVFVWDKFHDRYLISNIIGINLSNGFDISDIHNEMATWTRLGRSVRDDIQREFDPASARHKIQHRFTVS